MQFSLAFKGSVMTQIRAAVQGDVARVKLTCAKISGQELRVILEEIAIDGAKAVAIPYYQPVEELLLLGYNSLSVQAILTPSHPSEGLFSLKKTYTVIYVENAHWHGNQYNPNLDPIQLELINAKIIKNIVEFAGTLDQRITQHTG